MALPDRAAGGPVALVDLRKFWTTERVQTMGKVDVML